MAFLKLSLWFFDYFIHRFTPLGFKINWEIVYLQEYHRFAVRFD